MCIAFLIFFFFSNNAHILLRVMSCMVHDPLVHSVAFSVDHLGCWRLSTRRDRRPSVTTPLPWVISVPVYDVVERDGMVCDCWLVLLCCCSFAGASCVSPHITLYFEEFYVTYEIYFLSDSLSKMRNLRLKILCQIWDFEHLHSPLSEICSCL